jgi:hypothetical protein
MQRMPMALGILGLIVSTALPASAQTTVKLFGKNYTVVKESRAQTFKKQGGGEATIALVPRDVGSQLANLHFVEGADPSKDRLFVGCNIVNDDAVTAHQFYLLTGADANGVFSTTSASLTEFFGGNQNRQRGGRPTGFMWLNDDNTGAGVDRNIAISTFYDADYFRLFDLDKMDGVAGDNDSLPSDAVFSLALGDGDSPGTGFTCYARMPVHDGRTAVVFANSGGTAVGVWDTKKDTFYTVSTLIPDVTTDSTVQMPAEYRPTAAFHHSGNEYWVLAHDSEPGPTTVVATSNRLYRLGLTFPADLTKGQPGDIKVEILGFEELQGTPLHGKNADGEGHVYGIAKGREVAPGLFRLYFGDSEGNIFVATPAP